MGCKNLLTSHLRASTLIPVLMWVKLDRGKWQFSSQMNETKFKSYIFMGLSSVLYGLA